MKLCLSKNYKRERRELYQEKNKKHPKIKTRISQINYLSKNPKMQTSINTN